MTFRADPRNLSALRASLVSLGALAALSAALPFIPVDGVVSPSRGLLLVAFIGVAVFGGMAVANLRSLRRLPRAAVSVDTEGIWSAHRPRADGLVRWETIESVREGTLTPALKLYDTDDNILLRIEYQLMGFDKLRDLLYDRVDPHQSLEFPSTFTKHRAHHLGHLVLFTVLVLIGATAAGVGNGSSLGVFIVAILAIMVVFNYLWSAHSLTLRERDMIIRYPLSSHRLEYTNIASIDMTGTFQRGYRHPEIRILPKRGDTPHKLRKLGIDTHRLYRLLRTSSITRRRRDD